MTVKIFVIVIVIVIVSFIVIAIATVIKQLLDEVEHDIMNNQNRGLCYHKVLIIHDIMRKPNSMFYYTFFT